MAFGHDEELSGHEGAGEIAKWFEQRDIQVEFLLDEGMTILRDSPLPVHDVAIIGLAEKGAVEVDLTVRHPGGHASLVTGETAIDILSRAITKISDNPMPAQFDSSSPFYRGLEVLGPESQFFPLRMFLSNLWFFEHFFPSLVRNTIVEVTLRTTAASTLISGGVKSNVLPTEVRATINHRIIPGDTIASVVQHDKDVINDSRVQVTPRLDSAIEPSFVSNEKSNGYRLVARSVRESFGDVPVIPSIFVANSDTRHYWNVAKDIFRFCPTVMLPDDLDRFHGIDERIGIHNYFQIIQFYYQLIKNYE